MNSFINYIIESGISLGLLSIIYFIFLRNETFFKANRLFLLFSVIFSSILPLLHLKIYQSGGSVLSSNTGSGTQNILETVTVYRTGLSGSLADILSASHLVVFGYLTGAGIIAFLLIFRILQVIRIIMKGKVVQKTGIKFVYMEEDSSPYSFLDYLFVSKNLENNPSWEKMLAHETEHIRQGHTVDILILELISIFQWFNPFFWMLRRIIKENHEYMADQAVLSKGVPVDLYKRVLLCQLIGNQFSIANNFNTSLIKSRLKMMTKMKSSKLAGLRYITGGIMVVALLLVFACDNKDNSKQAIQEKNTQLNPDSDIRPLFIIDGEIASNEAFKQLNPDDIKSVSVYKENAEMYKKYGEKAKDGVIDIVLKSKTANNIDEVVAIKKETASSDDPVFFIVEKMPEFPGGEQALRKFIAQNIKYPAYASEHGIQGKVYVSFVVEKSGSVGRVKIARGVDPSLDAEALRVTKALPKWEPGKQKGEAVAISYTIPVNFVLQ